MHATISFYISAGYLCDHEDGQWTMALEMEDEGWVDTVDEKSVWSQLWKYCNVAKIRVYVTVIIYSVSMSLHIWRGRQR